MNDHEHESSETFTASLSTTDPNVNIGDGNVTITIIDDDEVGKFSIPAVSNTLEPRHSFPPTESLGTSLKHNATHQKQSFFKEKLAGFELTTLTF